eukprot:jgi/Astpho2/6927/Aster-01794
MAAKVEEKQAMQRMNEQLESENAALLAELSLKEKALAGAGLPMNSHGPVSAVTTDSSGGSAGGNSGSAGASGNAESVFRGRPQGRKNAEQMQIEAGWLQSIDELHLCLEELQLWDQRPKVGPDPEGEALGKLAGKLEQVVINCCEVAKMEGIQMDELLARTYDVCGTLKSWREPDRWINAAKECRLSAQQKQQLINLRMECLNRLKLELSRQLVDTVVPQIDSGSDQVIANAADDNSKLNKLSEALEQNLREEQQFNVQMLYAVFRFQLNPLQSAWLILKSFPEHVDALAFMNAVQECYAEEVRAPACAPGCNLA